MCVSMKTALLVLLCVASKVFIACANPIAKQVQCSAFEGKSVQDIAAEHQATYMMCAFARAQPGLQNIAALSEDRGEAGDEARIKRDAFRDSSQKR